MVEKENTRVPLLAGKYPAPEAITIPAPAPDPHAALKGLYNSPNANTVKAMISPGTRPQEIYTPKVVVDAILKVWPHIALDPCTGPGSIIPSLDVCYVKPKFVAVLKKGEPVLDKNGQPKVKVLFRADAGERDGLMERWVDYTYCNPPFSVLKDWMLKARHEGDDGLEIMLLTPVRPHRRWWRDVEDTSTETCFLDPITFEGYKASFPQPMCMMYWGNLPSLFRLAFERLGDCRRKPKPSLPAGPLTADERARLLGGCWK